MDSEERLSVKEKREGLMKHKETKEGKKGNTKKWKGKEDLKDIYGFERIPDEQR